jgi:hypothetical protein
MLFVGLQRCLWVRSRADEWCTRRSSRSQNFVTRVKVERFTQLTDPIGGATQVLSCDRRCRRGM